MKNRKIEWVVVFNIIAGFFFIASIYLSVKWSDIPVINMCLFNNSFWIHEGEVDVAFLNLVTGYFTGYLVYLFTVVIPTAYRNQVVMKEASIQLCSVYNKSIYLLFLMAKSAADETMWKRIISNSNDLDCFNDCFYHAMSRFDVTCEAETMLKHPDEDKKSTLKWYEYLEYQFNCIYKEIDDTVLRYQSSMPENLMECLYEIKTCSLMELILGKGINTSMIYKDMDGREYIESIPFSLYCKQASQKVTPIFSVNREIDGAEPLREFVSTMKKMYAILNKYVKDGRLKQNRILEEFAIHKIGRVGTSILIVKNNVEVK